MRAKDVYLGRNEFASLAPRVVRRDLSARHGRTIDLHTRAQHDQALAHEPPLTISHQHRALDVRA